MPTKQKIAWVLFAISAVFGAWLLWQATRYVFIGTSSISSGRIGIAMAIFFGVGFLGTCPWLWTRTDTEVES